MCKKIKQNVTNKEKQIFQTSMQAIKIRVYSERLNKKLTMSYKQQNWLFSGRSFIILVSWIYKKPK